MTCHILFIPLGVTIIGSTVPVASILDDKFCKSAHEIRITEEEIEDIQQANERVRRRQKVWYEIGILVGVAILVVGLYCGSMFSVNELFAGLV